MRVRLHYVIVGLLILTGCSDTPPDTATGGVAVTPDQWAMLRTIDACAILDESALAGLGKVSDRKWSGASAHNCVATVTAPDGTVTTIRAHVGERTAPDAQQIKLGSGSGYQDLSCAVTVKLTGDAGIGISVGGDDVQKQCIKAAEVATALGDKLQSPPRNAYASPFHGKDPCQPADQFAAVIGAVRDMRRPTMINCELTGPGGKLYVSQEIESMTTHMHGEPLTVGGKEAMIHHEDGDKERCEVMVLQKEAPENSYFTMRYDVASTSDPCGKAQKAAIDATH
jgi:hypothetical protein